MTHRAIRTLTTADRANDARRLLLLGRVAVQAKGAEHSLPRAQTRGVLAILALNARTPLSRHALVSALWGSRPPPTARQQVQNAIRQIRWLFDELGDPAAVESGAFGYRLDIEPTMVDAVLFQQQVRDAREAVASGDHQSAVRLFATGLNTWTGEPLSGASGSFVDAARARLVDIWLTAIEDLADLKLSLDRPEPVAVELTSLVHAYPSRERLRSLLMRALSHSGRPSEALQVYRGYRQHLADEEGLDPGADIAALALQIMRGTAEPRPPTPARPRRRPPAPVAVPAQLPRDIRYFAGRSEQLRALSAWLSEAAGAPPVLVGGHAGIGKTALAVHWAHRTREQVPDGQLYVNMRGSSAQPPLPAIAGLARCLRALGVDREEVPEDEDEAAALFRSVLADRRVLLLLDDVRHAGQVRPLLPGSPLGRVIITSRDPLDELVAIDGAERIDLGPLAPSEAYELLTYALGAERMGPDRTAATDLARLCDHLPLALRLAAARIKADPRMSIAAFAAAMAGAPAAVA